jgi:hypothetical protein
MSITEIFVQAEFPVAFLLLCGTVAVAAALLSFLIFLGAKQGRKLRR